MTSSRTSGIHHLGLTVADLKQAESFLVEVLGFSVMRRKPDYPAVFVSDGTIMLTLWQAQHDPPVAFDRKANVGLHHFALRLVPGVDLDELHRQWQARTDVQIEFGPEPMGPGPSRHMMCRIPGDLRMELVEPAT